MHVLNSGECAGKKGKFAGEKGLFAPAGVCGILRNREELPPKAGKKAGSVANHIVGPIVYPRLLQNFISSRAPIGSVVQANTGSNVALPMLHPLAIQPHCNSQFETMCDCSQSMGFGELSLMIESVAHWNDRQIPERVWQHPTCMAPPEAGKRFSLKDVKAAKADSFIQSN
eukprot:411741-Pelagomonas_calceolata.AAC.4